MKATTTAILLTSTTTAVSGFAFLPQNNNQVRSTTKLNGLFDGVKEAFSAPPSQLDSERETPIDRWMGWSVVSENAPTDSAVPSDFVDSMDEKNYVGVELTKPMGIVFEENDSEYGGIFVQSLKEGGVAAENGKLQPGDQLVAVGTKNVSGMDFDDALGAIIESEGDSTKLTLFRGTAKQFYGPTGPSKEWLSAFCEKGGASPQ
ncbi:PDZ domain containing protein [Nitzschia inconspicua]|uniref:PDZ domain containing protein n=1 Tax=Nitzschia inconspicua TaxID=303405 RepID=A0A9K3KRH6_9STRA|nr:PDZ domain containing protein [Nitzschia inconspicua]KAG7368846.1 PDZ domain containing protein [Nitzschia inconspicua]